MAHASQHGSSVSPRTSGPGYLFGFPLGDLGWFTSLLMSFAVGFAAFFAATFFAIFAVLIYNTATHHTVDFALTYKRVGIPVGLLVLMVALGYLGTLWVRRQLRKS
jgi:ABC-type dipeptide/oligopeptide/nickel transport system permease subunit